MAAIQARNIGDGAQRPAESELPTTVWFVCVREGRKLRVRITSENYNRNANCQFPKSIREEGRLYTAPATAVTFAQSAQGTVFYRVKKSAITIAVADEKIVRIAVERIFGDEDDPECCVCMDAERQQVFVPCGHYCCCGACAAALTSCPMCRAEITSRVDRDEI